MGQSWARIETWLREHAPASSRQLAPPAARTAIAAAEDRLGTSFPQPLVESLLRHDGTDLATVLPWGACLLGTEDIVRTWEMKMDIFGEDADILLDDPTMRYGPWWNRRWIPFAAFGNGDHLVIDGFGRVGEANHEDGGHFYDHPMWASLPDLFACVAEALMTGEILDGCQQFVTADGELDWDVV
ncbi:SMI1/KNR4 family protein [Streptomyces griseocarneus]|nr:SMI1/KNR4 family protein [Streptomyces griseocarneus]